MVLFNLNFKSSIKIAPHNNFCFNKCFSKSISTNYLCSFLSHYSSSSSSSKSSKPIGELTDSYMLSWSEMNLL